MIVESPASQVGSTRCRAPGGVDRPELRQVTGALIGFGCRRRYESDSPDATGAIRQVTPPCEIWKTAAQEA